MHLGNPSRIIVLATALAAVACGGSDGKPSTFELTIRPVPPPSQTDLFEDVELMVVRLTDSSGQSEEYEIDVARGTAPAIEDLPALPEGVVIEIEGYSGATDAAPLVARGRSDALDIGRAETGSVDIFMAAVGEMATFHELATGAWGNALASDGNGRFFVFGGAPDGWGDDGVDAITSWGLVPPDADFEPTLHTTFPTTADDWAGYTNEITGRVNHTATLLAEGTHGDVGKILVAGGWEALQESRGVTAQIFLFDPNAEPDQSIEVLDGLKTGRAQHKAVALSSGNVAFFGGYSHLDSNTQIDCPLTIEVYDAATRESIYGSDRTDECMVDGDAAAVGDMAMHCGGAIWTSNDTHQAVGDCVLVDRFANTSMVDGPSELAGAGWLLPAMASLGDNAVMVSGGVLIQGEAQDDDWHDATDKAFAYNSNNGTWSLLPPMKVARAGHVATALPGGQVLVAGGVARISNRGFDIDEELPCAEVFDPDALGGVGDWTLLDSTCQAGSEVGSLPQGLYRASITSDPYWGALIWSGIEESQSGQQKAQPSYALYLPELD